MKQIHAIFATLLALSTILISPCLAAQEASSTEISFRVLCVDHRDNVSSAFATGEGGNKVEVPLYTSDFSSIIKAKFVNGQASLFVEESMPDGKIQRKIVADGKLATGVRQAFLLIPTSSSIGPIYRIVAFEDGEETFPMGATRVINLAPFPIRLNLAGTDMPPVKPGGVSMIPQVVKVDEWNMYTTRIQFGVSADQWVDVATQSWKASNRKRDWVIARFDVTSKQPSIRQYQDVPPWRKMGLAAPAAADR
jgi:hypothetical protein